MAGLPALVRNSLRCVGNARRVVAEHSFLKVIVVLAFAVSILCGLTLLFYSGFFFLNKLGGMGLIVIQRLFALFFFGLAVMLVFSSLVSSYATLYRSDEIPHLLTRPLRHGEVAVYKCLEAAVLSSWAFFFMIVPFVAAFAWHQKLSLLFPVWTLLFSIPFVLLCSSIGSLACMLLVRWLPSGRAVLYAGALIALAVFAALGRAVLAGAPPVNDEASLVLGRLIPGLRLASNAMWPSWWVAEGILSLSRGDWARGGLFWAVLAANTLLAGVVIDAVGERIYYHGWQRGLAARIRARRRGMVTRRIGRLLFLAGRDVRALVVKDVRMFFRDPLQWSQGAVFFGLLAIYFLNLRNLHYDTLGPLWHNLIVFLNMISVSAVVCSLSSRFIYPQMSLEGHSFWVAGLSPMPMRRILMTKFRAAAFALVLTSVALMALTTQMLRVEPLLRATAMGIAVALPVGITGLAVGLGAVFLDLRQRNPAAIVSSYGGTLNLVLGMVYTLSVVLGTATLFHLRGTGRVAEDAFRNALPWAATLVFVVTIAVTWYPLKLGYRKLAEGDY